MIPSRVDIELWKVYDIANIDSEINTFRQKGTEFGARVTLNKKRCIKAIPLFA
jgi:hypothetical protein